MTQQVANRLILADGMRERSEPLLDTDRLTVRLVSNEERFLFKLIAGRDDDFDRPPFHIFELTAAIVDTYQGHPIRTAGSQRPRTTYLTAHFVSYPPI